MKTSFWRSLAAFALAAAVLLSSAALAEARYPARQGALTDDANALGTAAAVDIASYAKEVESQSGVKLNVAVVLFLDGETPQAYADKLFTRWELGEDDLLLLGAAAEDSFALSAGTAVSAKLSAASLKALTYDSGFAEHFKAQRYDAAFGTFFVAFNGLLAKQYGVNITLGERFAAYQPQQQAQQAQSTGDTLGQAVGNAVDQALSGADSALQGVVDASSSLWSNAMNAINNHVNQYEAYQGQRDEGGNGLTPGGWVVLAIIALIIFGQSGPARRARRAGGCGCGPIGWIFSALGLGALLGRHQGDRDAQRDPRGEQRNQQRAQRDQWHAQRDQWHAQRDQWRDQWHAQRDQWREQNRNGR